MTRVESAAASAESEPLELTTRASLLDRYTLLRKLGEGGMGVVYSAFDEELGRRVAIKLLRTGESGERGAARMLREAQAMARLSHPHVVQVYDVGLIGGQLFMAMEYVQGQSLSEWVRSPDVPKDSKPRPWREVVAMFGQAGAGLAAAHAAGVVHRDFKPDNVLVGVDGRARVLDFGLAARAEGPAGLDEDERSGRTDLPPEVTQSGRHQSLRMRSLELLRTAAGTLIGTPAYMSPEQHLRQPTDARSDQFSFCVALYEGLYGERPFAGVTVGELTRSVLAGRVREPSGRKVPGWLRRVVLRGLSLAPEDRYPDMTALLAALTADPRRTRARWLAALGVAAAVGVSVAAARQQRAATVEMCKGAGDRIAQVWRPERAQAIEAALRATGRAYADDTWSRVHDHINMYSETWQEVYVRTCEATWVRGEQSAELLDLRMACLSEGLDELGALVTVLAEADEQVAERAVQAVAALRSPQRCDDAQSLRATDAMPAALAAAVQEVRSKLVQARAEAAAGRYPRAHTLAMEAVAAAEATRHAPTTVEALLARGQVEEQLQDHDGAARTLLDAYARAETVGHAPAKAESATLLIKVTGGRLAHDEEARLWARLAAAVLEHLGWPIEARVDYHAALGTWHSRFGRETEAIAAFDEALALEAQLAVIRPNQSLFHRLRGNALYRLGRVPEAAAEYERAVALAEQSYGPEHPEVGSSINNLGEVLRVAGDLDAAEARFRRAAAIQERAFGADHPAMAPPLNGLASVAYARGDLETAEHEFRRVAAVFERTHGPELALVLGNVGEVELRRGKYVEARATLERALELFRAGLGIDHPLVFDVRANLAAALVALGELEEATAEYDAAISAIEKAHGPAHPDLMKPLTGRARLASTRRDPGAAVPLFERALQLGEAAKADAAALAELRFGLADALWDSREDRARARALVEAARTTWAAAGATEQASAAEQWLARRAQ